MLSEYQFNADLYSIPFGNVEKLVPNLFDKEKYWCFLWRVSGGVPFLSFFQVLPSIADYFFLVSSVIIGRLCLIACLEDCF